MSERTTEEVPAGSAEDRSTIQVVKSIASDSATLVRKEVELAKQEIQESLMARIKAAGAFGAAGMIAFLGVLCGLTSVIAALSTEFPVWLSALIMMGALFAIAGIAALVGALRKKPPIAPTETVRTVKEDVEWAKTQLKR